MNDQMLAGPGKSGTFGLAYNPEQGVKERVLALERAHQIKLEVRLQPFCVERNRVWGHCGLQPPENS
jgi:hypothetical protein